MSLIEVSQGKWRIDKRSSPAARSALPRPYVISDEMPPTEHVDGNFYTSKRMYSAVSRAHGLTEVGNEKFKPKRRATDDPAVKRQRRDAIGKAVAEFRAGRRAKSMRGAA